MKRLYQWHVPVRLCFRWFLSSCLSAIQSIVFSVRGTPRGRAHVVVAKDALSVAYAVNFVEWARDAGIKSPIVIWTKKSLMKAVPDDYKQNCAVDLSKLLFTQWKSAVFPSHGYAPYIHHSIPRIWIGHGIEGGRIMFGGSPYTYSWKALTGPRRPAYSAMLCSSQSEFDMCGADRYGKALTPRLFLGTEPAARRLLQLTEQYKTTSTKPRLFISSTWVAGCLYDQIVPQIYRIQSELNEAFDVTWSFHQRLVDRPDFEAFLQNFAAAGAKVIPPKPDAWLRSLAASDVMIGDVTSLALYFAALGRPVLFSESAHRAQLAHNSPLAELIKTSRTIDFSRQISPQVRAALDRQNLSSAQSFRQHHFAHLSTNRQLEDYFANGIKAPN